MLKDLCQNLAFAKEKLASLNRYILEIENDIIAMLPPKLEGSQMVPVKGWKVTTTHKLTRKLDFEAYQALDLPDSMQFVNLKPTIDLFKLRSIERLDPALVAKCVTTKPAKTAVKIEEVDDESC